MTHSSSSHTQGFCVEVAPLTSIPLSRSPLFTYFSEQEVAPGSLVTVPLFTRSLQGIVFKSMPFSERPAETRHFKLKPVERVLKDRFLTEEQLRLAQFLAQEYFTALGRCLVHFTPHITKARHTPVLPKPQPEKRRPIRLTQEQKTVVELFSQPSKKPFYLFGPASSGKTEVYMRSIQKKLKNDEQALILVPELTLLPQEQERYGAFFGEEQIAVLHSHMAPGRFFQAWEKIRRGEVKIILGTRQALFAPFRKLSVLVVDEEQDDAYKQWDMSPRYDARTLAEVLAQIHGANLIFGSATPGLERFYRTQTQDYTLATLSPLPQQPEYSIDLVNLCLERWKKNASLLSATLAMELGFALKHKRQALIFINRQGMSTFTTCVRCQTLLRCPACDRALVYDAAEGVYRCLHCPHKSGSFPACGQCGGMDFKNFGIGTQKVEREILKQFPQARVLRMDRQTMAKSGAQEKAYRLFAEGKADILIGTQMSTKGWDLPNITLVGIIDSDSLFAFPDFKTDEKAFQHLLQAVGRMARIGSRFPGKAVIQTFHPENAVLAAVQKKDFLGFFRHTLDQRQDLSYPPFGRLIKLVFQDKDLQKVERETQKTYRRLQEIARDLSRVAILPPYAPMVSKTRGHHRKHLIIRLKRPDLPPEIRQFLQTVSGTWAIDVDPINLV
jgi:primosomal protein N' (replication factor Y)